MEQPQPLGLVDEGLALLLGECPPLAAKVLGDLGVVSVGVPLDDLPPLQLGPDHEGVHRPLHVVLLVLLRLKQY